MMGSRTRASRAGAPGLIVLLIAIVGCLGEDPRSAFSPPGSGNRTTLRYEAVSSGGSMNCALVNGGAAMCWGRGTLGDGSTTESTRPVRVSGSIIFGTLSAAQSIACGTSTNGVAFCWGANIQGSLGNGTSQFSPIPVQVATSVRFTRIATHSHTCAVSTEGVGYCWGQNGQGQLGDGSGASSSVPAEVAGGLRFSDIVVGAANSCGITSDGEAHCWGRDWGNTPQPVPTAQRFEAVAMDLHTSCGLTAEGAIFCWGWNERGQFGNGTRDEGDPPSYHTSPVRVDSPLAFSKLAVGAHHVCATAQQGGIYCWGSDDVGEIGDGTPPGQSPSGEVLFPARVSFGREVRSLDAGVGSSCAVTTDSEAYCWGWFTGNPRSGVSDVPVRVGG